jgi:hypothetical protein
VRQAWFSLFIAFMVLQAVLVGLGVFLATGGKNLAVDATQKLDAMRQVFQSITALGVVACMFLTRAKLHPDVVKTPADLFRGTLICLMMGEVTVLIALIGLAKLHLAQFLVASALVFLADFILVLPAGKRVLSLPSKTSGTQGNKDESSGN